MHHTTSKYEIVKFICEKAQEGDPSDDKFAIPFNSDLDGNSPLHLSIPRDEEEEDKNNGESAGNAEE